MEISCINWRNWEEYYHSFCNVFVSSLCEMRTDPDRFARDKRHNNGFWMIYPVTGLRGTFNCSEVSSCSWRTKDAQVDVMFRYNFEHKRGEIKIVKEYRQRCKEHGGALVEPVLGESGGAKEVMKRLRGYIRGRFYKERRSEQTRTRFTSTGSSVSTSSGNGWTTDTSSRRGPTTNSRYDSNNNNVTPQRNKLPYYKPTPDHLRFNCEACMLSRCPIVIIRPGTRDLEHCIKGNTCNKESQLDFIQWALLDAQGEPYYAV